MEDSLLPNLKKLKTALLKLDPFERDRFESLIAVTRREITGTPFRIAGGSYQGVSGGVGQAISTDSDFKGRRIPSRACRMSQKRYLSQRFC
jgi:hypothetical protein